MTCRFLHTETQARGNSLASSSSSKRRCFARMDVTSGEGQDTGNLDLDVVRWRQYQRLSSLQPNGESLCLGEKHLNVPPL